MDKVNNTIEGVLYTPMKKIINPKGDLFHILRNFDKGYDKFGEAYISTIKYREIKAWKKHYRMISNIVVPIGVIKFVVYDDREESTTYKVQNEFILSPDAYFRLTIPPKVWYGFTGLNEGVNMIINIANIPHDPEEQTNKELKFINYNWK